MHIQNERALTYIYHPQGGNRKIHRGFSKTD